MFPLEIPLCVTFEKPHPSSGVNKRPNGIFGSGGATVVVGASVVVRLLGQQMESPLCAIQIEVDC